MTTDKERRETVQDKPLARPDDTDSSARGKNGPETKVAVEKTLEKTADRCRGPKGKKLGDRGSQVLYIEKGWKECSVVV